MMKKMLDFIKKKNLCFIFYNIYIVLMILIPKSLSTLFNVVPIRLLLSCLLVGVYVIDKYFLKNSYHKMNRMLMLFFGLFLAATIPSFFVTKDLIVTIYTFIKFAVTIFVLKIFFTKDFTKEQYKVLLKSLLISSALVILYGIIQYIFGFGLQTIGIENYAPAKGRVISNFFNTIYFGLFINLVIAFLLHFINSSSNIKLKICYSVLLILGFSAILLTFSRSSFLVFGGLIFLILILNYKMIFNKFAFASLLICFGLLFTIPGANKLFTSSVEDAYSLFSETAVLKQFLPSVDIAKDKNSGTNNKENLESPEASENEDELENEVPETTEKPIFDDYSLEHRKDFAVISNRIANKYALTGVGFGAYLEFMNSKEFSVEFSDYTGTKTHPHSAFVLTYAEVGIVALAFLVVFYVYFVILAFKELICNFKRKNYSLAVALFVTIVGFLLVNIVSENAIYDSQLYIIFLIIVGLAFNYLLNDLENRKNFGKNVDKTKGSKAILKKSN